MRDRKQKRIVTVFIALVAMVSTYLPHLPILPAQQVFAQTPNTEVEAKPVEKAPVSGNFIDYYAEERQLKGHEGSVNSANFSPNGKFIVTAGVDKTARIWDFSGQQLQVLRGHEGSVRSANFSPNGQLIVTASFDRTARVWDNSGKELVSLKGHEGKLFSANFSPDGQRIVTAGVDGVRLWDTDGKQLGEIKGHLGSVYSANFSPDGKLIVTAGADKTARIWDSSGKFLTELKGHTDTVWSANFSPDSQQVVTASEDKTARVWDLSGKELAVLSAHVDTVWSASFSPDGQKIVTASVDRIGRLWDLEGRLLAKLQQHTDGVNSGSFSFDGKWIVTAGNDGTGRVWDINSKLLTELKVSDTPVEELRDRSLEGASASFSANGKFIVTESNHVIRVWDSSGTLLFEREGEYASFSPDSTKIITLSGGTPYICDISGKLLLTIQSQNGEHNLGINKAVFSPDSKHIATVSDDDLQLWDLRGKPIVKFKENIYFYADDIEFSPDGKFIITSKSSQNSTLLWNIASKFKIELKGHKGHIKSNNFSPDSKYIVTASRNGDVLLWDNSGKFIIKMQGHQDALYSAKFSSDGKLIITTSLDGTAILWDIYGKALLKIQGDKSSIVSASLSSDNKRILTTYRDGSAKIWDLSGKELVLLQGHKHGVNGIFSPDDKRIITASWDGSVKVWYLLNKHLHQLALPENISSKKAKLRYDSREQQLNRRYKNINSISFSHDEKLVATAFGDDKKYNAQIWDISGKLLFELQGHEGSVNSVNFSYDNKYIVTASSDKTARIWNTSGKQIVILTGQNKILNSAVFSPDNDYIVTSSEYIVCILDSKESITLKYKQTSEHNITNQHAKNQYAKVNKEEAVDTSLNCKATLRHQEPIINTIISPNSKFIITTSYNTTSLWDMTGNLITEFKGSHMTQASFSSDSQSIAIAHDDVADIYDVSGKLKSRFKIGSLFTTGQNKFQRISFSPDGKKILISNGGVKIFDIWGKLITNFFQSDVGVFSPDGDKVITISNSDIMFWNVSEIDNKLTQDISKKLLKRFNIKTSLSLLSNIVISPNGNFIATIPNDLDSFNQPQLWNMSGQLVAELKISSSPNIINFSPDGKLIVTTSESEVKNIKIWNNSGKFLTLFKQKKTNKNFSVLKFSPDSQRIINIDNNVVYIRDTSGNILNSIRHEKESINDVIFSHDSKYIITIGSNTVRVWNNSGKLQCSIKHEQGRINYASFNLDGKYILTKGTDTTFRVWDNSGKQILKLGSPQKIDHYLELRVGGEPEVVPDFTHASFSPNGKLIAASDKNRITTILDVSGKKIAELKGTYLSFNPDSKHILTMTDEKTVKLWDIYGKSIADFRHHQYIEQVVFSPNGKFISIVTQGTVENSQLSTEKLDRNNTINIWNISGEKTAEIQGLYQGFSPDSKMILTIFVSKSTLKNARDYSFPEIRDTSGKLLASLKIPRYSVENASFSPDSKLVVTNSWDEIPRIWDISGNMLAKFRGNMLAKFRENNLIFNSIFKSAEFSPDGKRIITVYDGTSILWDLSGKQLARFGENPNSSPKVEADRLRDLEFYAPNCDLALEPWQKALKIYREIDEHENHTLMYEKLGNAYSCLSDYSKAIQSYSQGLLIAQKFKYSERQATILSTLGNVYNTLVEDDTALQKYDEALKILPQGNSRLKSEVLRGRGNIYNLRGSFPEAVKDYQEALNIDESIKNESAISESQVQLASIYLALEDINKATQYYKDNLDFNEIESLAGLGRIELLLSNVDKSITLFNKSLRAAEQLANKEGKGNAFYNLGLAYYKLGQLPEAEQNLRNAIEVWENLRLNLEDTNKISIFEKQTRTYRLLQQILIAQNQPDKALEISESGRARAFVELLSQKLSPNPKEESKITPPDLNQIKQIADSQNATIVQYSIIYDESKNESKAQKQESKLYIWVVKPNDEKIEFTEVNLNKYLQADDINLEELVNNSRESFGVYRNASRAKTPVTNTPGKRDQFLITINPELEKENLTEYLEKLHKILIAPIAQFLPKYETQRVIFVPQGELFLVPFPALIDETGKHLIEKHTILTAPSIQVLELTRKAKEDKKQINPRKALVVGNPTMPDASLKSLEGAEAEAKAISCPTLLNTKPLIGKAATETEVVAKMPQAKIIHLATHGLFDDLRGLGSAIALAPSGKDDGLLTAEEILNFKQKLNADLVVLSACDTGRGRITGDGVIGLSRAFISAGVPSVVVSLWAVPDGETAFLMERFYENWLQNIDEPDKATALRNAMLTTKQKYPNPRQWAAFTLIGEAE
ncbi:MAG: CHAT domain-containing protein [Tolypothrix brevis GSE-NOS-MK-07-07A]|jgi:WD40 repeat protein/CHAT domain-containing protein/TPR repeat protein|nr:CHAT domain-containing protein [Tolypothrix brevis GSE-NOS-MK-07-07A]